MCFQWFIIIVFYKSGFVKYIKAPTNGGSKTSRNTADVVLWNKYIKENQREITIDDRGNTADVDLPRQCTIKASKAGVGENVISLRGGRTPRGHHRR